MVTALGSHNIQIPHFHVITEAKSHKYNFLWSIDTTGMIFELYVYFQGCSVQQF